jgi:hypothetical protein
VGGGDRRITITGQNIAKKKSSYMQMCFKCICSYVNILLYLSIYHLSSDSGVEPGFQLFLVLDYFSDRALLFVQVGLLLPVFTSQVSGSTGVIH